MWNWMRLACSTLGRDLELTNILVQTVRAIKKWINSGLIVGDFLTKQAKKNPTKKAYVSADTGESLTFEEAENLANKIANVFHEAGFRKGDTVALIMENRIEYVPIWVGLSKIGVVTSLINFNLRGDSLQHCIEVSHCKAVIFSKELSCTVDDLNGIDDIQFYCFDTLDEPTENIKQLKTILPTASSSLPPRPDDISLRDEVLHIYTSGTTGLPKAAIIRGARCMMFCRLLCLSVKVTANDTLYNALPLYHSSGGLGLAGNTFLNGCTLVIKKKFSASKFFQDCCQFGVNIFIYIGEICRYLLATPPTDFDKAHNVRIIIGNGLRASIWQEFQDRFNIPKIVEFYASTEGNANMVNIAGRVGAVGFNTVLYPILKIKLVKFDEDTGELVRDANGLAAPVPAGDVGVLVGGIKDDPTLRFDGYLNKEATKKKLIHDVFKKGDSAFVTGDLLMQDKEGFYYFRDRTGDTFRWKGENVSTNEVEGVISKALQLNDVCVYGVEVPGLEGRAGMACIQDPEKKVNLGEFQQSIEEALPPYARPMFIRQTSEISKTGTHKFKKNKLQEEGFNPSVCDTCDSLYYFDGKTKKYLPIDSTVYDSISKQEIRF